MVRSKNNKGAILVTVILMTGVFIAIFFGAISLSLLRQKQYNQQIAKEQAIHVAEAGVNYYRWLLAHNRTDFYDGKGYDPGPAGQPYGPYVHSFNDSSGSADGTFSLEITPPPTGSTMITITSTGCLNNYPNIKRTVEAVYGIPSFAHYSFLTNTSAWFGSSENLQGEVHSNGGLRIDGTNDSIISSALNTYTCPSSHGCTNTSCNAPCSWIGPWSSGYCRCPGVWGASANSSLFRYPVPTINFTNITADYLRLRAQATSTGDYYTAAVNNNGFYITLSGNTYSVHSVNSKTNNLSQYNDSWSSWSNISEDMNNTSDLSPAVHNRAIPDNGVIFFENDIWIEGSGVDGKVTIVAARVGGSTNQYKSIFINNNITYLARDGSNMIGLIAQKDIKVLRRAPTNTIIDAFLLSQNGHVFRNLYRYSSDRLVKNSIEIYGGIISYLDWNWTWTSGASVIDGYTNTTTIYDTNGTYSPPPLFPTTGEYVFISWNEK